MYVRAFRNQTFMVTWFTKNDFSFQFRKIITRYRLIGYNLNVMRQSACLVFNPNMVDNNAAFFCQPGFKWYVFVSSGFQYVIWRPGISIVEQLTESVSPRFS